MARGVPEAQRLVQDVLERPRPNLEMGILNSERGEITRLPYTVSHMGYVFRQTGLLFQGNGRPDLLVIHKYQYVTVYLK